MYLPHLTFLSQNQMYEVVLAMRERKHPHITCTSVTFSKTGDLVEKTDGWSIVLCGKNGRTVGCFAGAGENQCDWSQFPWRDIGQCEIGLHSY